MPRHERTGNRKPREHLANQRVPKLGYYFIVTDTKETEQNYMYGLRDRELDGILAKEGITGATPLPIWYELTYEDVYDFSPTLSGLYSLSTDQHSIADICQSFKLILEKEEIRSN